VASSAIGWLRSNVLRVESARQSHGAQGQDQSHRGITWRLETGSRPLYGRRRVDDVPGESSKECAGPLRVQPGPTPPKFPRIYHYMQRPRVSTTYILGYRQLYYGRYYSLTGQETLRDRRRLLTSSQSQTQCRPIRHTTPSRCLQLLLRRT
jgi:hypothetical protein